VLKSGPRAEAIDSTSGFRPRTLLLILLLVTLAAKLVLAWRFDGYGTGDDLEIVETAAKYAAGLDYQPWSLRCLFHPLVLTWPVLRLGVLAGVTDPSVLSWLGAIPTALFSTLAIFLVYRLALAWRWPSETALAAAFLYAVHWLPFGYGTTLFPRPISTAFLLGAFLLSSRVPLSAARAAAAGVLVAAAFAVRWSEGAALAPLAAWIWWRDRDARTTAAVVAGFALGALVFVGLTDTLTWGRPFSSLKAYANEMRTVPPNPRTDGAWYEYAKDILRWAGPVCVLLLWPARRDRRIRLPLLFLAAIVVALSCVRFKQTRYMQAAIPFLALAAAVGWERLRESGAVGRRIAAAALLLAAALGLERSVALLSDKSQSATAAARAIARLSPAPRAVALEQAWAYGDRLLIGNGPEIRDFPPSRPLAPADVEKAAGPADTLGLYTLDTSPALLDTIARMGFRESARFHRDASKEVILYLRDHPPRASAGR
jgi:Alg9-like mannosyltransferase family